jgi:hypothetical protein
MLSGHQHDIAIVMIVVSGIESGAALVYLLYKKASPFFRRRRKAGSALKSRFRRARATPERALEDGTFALYLGDLREVPEPSENVETDLGDLKKLMEQVVVKITEVNATVKEANTTVKDSSLKIDGVSTQIDEASTKVDEASTKIDGVASGVTDIRNQLDKAGHVAIFWNVSSLLFGVAGVVIGILAL